MPYRWTTLPAAAGAATTQARLWQHRSLSRRGFVAFIAITFGLILLPLLPVLGTPVLWGLLPFLMAAVWGIYAAIQRSYRDGEVSEELRLTASQVDIVRHDPRGAVQEWHANRHWVRAHLHEKGGPVPFYLTLSGGGREVELGAFLTEIERRQLYDELRRLLEAGAP